MERTEIVSLYKNTPADGTVVTVCGWAKTVRDSKNIGFISLSDGSCYKPVQIVFQADKLENYAEVAKSGLYTSFEVTGTLVLTPNAKQPFEINADTVTVLGTCGSDYPLQKNKMGMDYLRTLTHLRPRTNTFNAAFRVRGQAAYALHEFFHKNGFTYVHTPIFTGSDCEGAGEMFQVTTLDLNDVPKTEDGKVDYSKDFFKRPVNLTVSGQLEAEAMAMALGKVYTFGPTFRAEKSYDTRHAAEFWMIEPEMAFADLNTYMDTAEAMTKYVIRYLLDNCPDELAFFNQFFDKGLIERLELVANSDFARVSYTDAIELLKKNDHIRDINNALVDSNRIKDRYVCHYIDLSVHYIKQIDAFRREVCRIAKTKGADEVVRRLNSSQVIDGEYQKFYQSFDSSFLDIFPNFIGQVNELLQPEFRFTPRSDSSLTTELRILAAIRLGITDSGHIASLLNCASATVYTYRTKLRNAALDRDDFESQVARIGL